MEKIIEKYQMLTIAVFNLINIKEYDMRDLQYEEAKIQLQKLRKEIEKYWEKKN